MSMLPSTSAPSSLAIFLAEYFPIHCSTSSALVRCRSVDTVTAIDRIEASSSTETDDALIRCPSVLAFASTSSSISIPSLLLPPALSSSLSPSASLSLLRCVLRTSPAFVRRPRPAGSAATVTGRLTWAAGTRFRPTVPSPLVPIRLRERKRPRGEEECKEQEGLSTSLSAPDDPDPTLKRSRCDASNPGVALLSSSPPPLADAAAAVACSKPTDSEWDWAELVPAAACTAAPATVPNRSYRRINCRLWKSSAHTISKLDWGRKGGLELQQAIDAYSAVLHEAVKCRVVELAQVKWKVFGSNSIVLPLDFLPVLYRWGVNHRAAFTSLYEDIVQHNVRYPCQVDVTHFFMLSHLGAYSALHCPMPAGDLDQCEVGGALTPAEAKARMERRFQHNVVAEAREGRLTFVLDDDRWLVYNAKQRPAGSHSNACSFVHVSLSTMLHITLTAQANDAGPARWPAKEWRKLYPKRRELKREKILFVDNKYGDYIIDQEQWATARVLNHVRSRSADDSIVRMYNSFVDVRQQIVQAMRKASAPASPSSTCMSSSFSSSTPRPPRDRIVSKQSVFAMYSLPFDLSRTRRMTYNVNSHRGVENVLIATMRWGYPPHHPLPYAAICSNVVSSAASESPLPSCTADCASSSESPPLHEYAADFKYRFLEYLLEVEYDYSNDDPNGVVSTARFHLRQDEAERASGRSARFNTFETAYIRGHAAMLEAKVKMGGGRAISTVLLASSCSEYIPISINFSNVGTFEKSRVDLRFDHAPACDGLPGANVDASMDSDNDNSDNDNSDDSDDGENSVASRDSFDDIFDELLQGAAAKAMEDRRLEDQGNGEDEFAECNSDDIRMNETENYRDDQDQLKHEKGEHSSSLAVAVSFSSSNCLDTPACFSLLPSTIFTSSDGLSHSFAVDDSPPELSLVPAVCAPQPDPLLPTCIDLTTPAPRLVGVQLHPGPPYSVLPCEHTVDLPCSLVYLSIHPARHPLADAIGAPRHSLPCWVPQLDVSAHLFASAGAATLAAVEANPAAGGPPRYFVWAPEFSNVHTNMWCVEPTISIDGKDYVGGPEVWYQLMKSKGAMVTVSPAGKDISHEAALKAFDDMLSDPAVADKPYNAWKLGQAFAMHEDWDHPDGQLRISVMEKAVRAKFTDPTLRALLLSTHHLDLVQLKPSDHFWGTGSDGQGRNELGKMLMRIRDTLTTPSASSSSVTTFSHFAIPSLPSSSSSSSLSS